MTEKIVALVFQFVIHVINAGGYAGIVGLITLNSCGIPIPSEAIMPFSGYLAYLGRFDLFFVAIAGAVGCNIGSAMAYWIGAKGGRPLVARYGKLVLMNSHDLDLMARFFEKYGSIAILIGTHVADGADLRCFSCGNRQNAAAAFSHLHHFGFPDLVLLPGVGGHEARPKLEYRSAPASKHFITFIWPWNWPSSHLLCGSCGYTSSAGKNMQQ